MKLSDSGGLQLWVTPQGGKYWRMAYRFASKQRVLAIGVYPATSLKVARSARDKAREALAAGLDPSQKKRLDRIAARAVSVSTLTTGRRKVVAALQLLALTFVRPGELRNADWSEFDMDAAIWTVPPGRMKMRRPHRVPLAPQALGVLKRLEAITGNGRLLFPSVWSPDRCMSENTVNAALRRLGYGKDEMTGHGFRSAASSMLNESGLWNPDASEAQLAHVENNAVRRAYARADFWDERVKMLTWADRLDTMRRAPEIVRLRA